MQKKTFKRTALTFVLVVLAAQVGFAQSSFDDEVNSELDRMYQTQGAGQRTASPTVQVNVKSSPLANSNQSQVQKQPTTVIESTPLVESRAERIRRERQEVELATEQRIVERLEQSRIEDEKRRMENLFGDRINQQPVQQAQPVVVPVQQVQAVTAAPVVEAQDTKQLMTYMGVGLGMPGYSDVNNVRANYSASVVYGREVTSSMAFEIGFQMSNYEISQRDGVMYYGVYYPRLTNMDQYQGLIALKGVFMEDSIFRPTGGVLLSYSQRNYRDIRISAGNNVADSQAVDAGLTAGFDVDLTQKFSVGLDLRYMWNMFFRTSTDNIFRPYGMQNSNPIERLPTYQFMVAGKFYF